MKKLAILSIILFALAISERSQAQRVENKPPLDNFYEKVNNVGKEPRPYVPVREADVYIKRRLWRMIDFRQTFNQFFYFPIQPVQDRVSFMSMVMTGLKEGSITAYDPITDDFTKPLTYEEFIAANTNIREVEIEDLDNPGVMIQRTDTSSFSNADVKMLRVKEDWFIDRQRGVRDIRILGLCPVIQRFDPQTNEFRGNQNMFWVYYPECRDLFVNTEAFNRHNSALRMSYDDVFSWKRFFNSFVTKADNQQDRQIQEFLTGWQLLAESDRIQMDLLNLEEDLWEY
ncbi:MAG: gliding motility protein GldN [Bacteroidales bacterium]|nr:gliding motility protein GldN [Bacteroidales bacterium]